MADERKTRLIAERARPKAGADRTLTFTFSTQEVARDGDIILADAWDTEAFMRNPVVLWSHNPVGAPPIGRVTEIRKVGRGKARKLEGDIEFAGFEQMHELAESVFLLYRDGFLNAVSVGFIPREHTQLTEEERQKKGLGPWGQEWTAVELLEVSAVSVPADTGALIQNAADPGAVREALLAVRSALPEGERQAIDELLGDEAEDDGEEPEADATADALRFIKDALEEVRRDITAIRKRLGKSKSVRSRSAPNLVPDEPTADQDEEDLWRIGEAITQRKKGLQ